MGRQQEATRRRSLPLWAKGGLLLILVIATVQSCAGAWTLATTNDADCPSVVDTNPGRGVDDECAPGDGGSRGSAILVLVTIGMIGAVCAVYALPGIVRDLRGGSAGAQSEPAEDPDPQLADDLADLDDLHHRGLLTADELRAARDRRLDRD